MNLLALGTEDIVADSGQTIGAITTQVVSSPFPAYTNLTVTYVPGTSYTFGVIYLTADQTIYTMENSATQILPDLPCSISGSTSISFSTANYMASTVPSWVAIDSVSGILSINAPEVSMNIEFDFYVNSAVSGVSSPIQKLIKLIITNCAAKNWKKCISTNSLVCDSCVSGYVLTSGMWDISKSTTSQSSQTTSETAKALSKTTMSVVIVIIGIVVLTSIVNTTSIANLWMTINQLQLFLLLLLTRAYIPKDVQIVIEGCDFASNIYEYFSIHKLSIFQSFLRKFEFDLTNQSLEPLGINYDSTVANISSVLFFTFLMTLISLLIYFIRKLANRCRESQRCSWGVKIQYWIVDRLYRMMVLGYFIRNWLEMSQFILISSVNEIYLWNIKNFYPLFSFVFSILMILIFVLVVILVLYLTFSTYRLDENEHNLLEEFFRGIQQNKRHKLYVTLLLLRRFIFVILLITWLFISSRVLIIMLFLIQVFYILNLSYLRPYEETKGNLIEIFNEIYFGFLILFLAIVNTEDEWNSIKTNIYMWVLVSNTFVMLVIVLGKN